MPSAKAHWEEVYSTKPETGVSWYQEHSEHSLDLIERTGVAKDGAIIDVGGGTSRLVDDLLDRGFSALTVLDISATALDIARGRLGERSGRTNWIEADITTADLPARAFDLWHDRAVFHFLTRAEDREAYVRAVQRSVRPGGHVIVAAFGLEGPLRCSGLPVVRYSPGGLHDEFGPSFELVEHRIEDHTTPSAAVQKFIYCYCRNS
jgi:ubiquinone/menaquinone biosynthesis C-methylase UbiE